MIPGAPRHLVGQQDLADQHRVVRARDEVPEPAAEDRVGRDVVVQERLAGVEDEQRLRHHAAGVEVAGRVSDDRAIGGLGQVLDGGRVLSASLEAGDEAAGAIAGGQHGRAVEGQAAEPDAHFQLHVLEALLGLELRFEVAEPPRGGHDEIGLVDAGTEEGVHVAQVHRVVLDVGAVEVVGDRVERRRVGGASEAAVGGVDVAVPGCDHTVVEDLGQPVDVGGVVDVDAVQVRGDGCKRAQSHVALVDSGAQELDGSQLPPVEDLNVFLIQRD